MSKLVERVKVIRLTPFPVNVWVVVTNDLRASVENAFEKLDCKGQVFDGAETTGAVTITKADSGDIYAILPFDVTLEQTAHEVYHVVRHIARFTGVDDNEFMAHYIGYLTSELRTFTKEVDKRGRKT